MARKQGELAGMERPTIKEVDDAAEAYHAAMKKRIKLGAKEKLAKVTLIAVMEKNNITAYSDQTVNPPLDVVLVPGKTGVKVTARGEEEEKEEEPEMDS